jgi:hypothetical protein
MSNRHAAQLEIKILGGRQLIESGLAEEVIEFDRENMRPVFIRFGRLRMKASCAGVAPRLCGSFQRLPDAAQVWWELPRTGVCFERRARVCAHDIARRYQPDQPAAFIKHSELSSLLAAHLDGGDDERVFGPHVCAVARVQQLTHAPPAVSFGQRPAQACAADETDEAPPGFEHGKDGVLVSLCARERVRDRSVCVKRYQLGRHRLAYAQAFERVRDAAAHVREVYAVLRQQRLVDGRVL